MNTAFGFGGRQSPPSDAKKRLYEQALQTKARMEARRVSVNRIPFLWLANTAQKSLKQIKSDV